MSLIHVTGTCHCGAVRFEAEIEPDKALSCNCSICARRGSLLAFAPREAVTVTVAEEVLGEYRFNRHIVAHRFCKTCGIHTHGEGALPDGTPVLALNLRCVEGLDPESLTLTHYDGRSL